MGTGIPLMDVVHEYVLDYSLIYFNFPIIFHNKPTETGNGIRLSLSYDIIKAHAGQ
jgi:hypothetical protein